MSIRSFPQGHSAHHLPGHERRDASVGWVFGVVAFLFVSGLIMHLFLGGFAKTLSKAPMPSDRWQPSAKPVASVHQPSPFPYLQVAPALDLADFQARQRSELNGYSWVNKSSGVVHIPIERAMALLMKKGLPVRTSSNQDDLAPSSFELQQQRVLNRQPQKEANQ